MKNLGGGGGKEGSERREGRWGGNKGREREQERKREKSNRDKKKIYALTKSESMTSTTLYSHDTASHPVLPTLLGTV